MLVEIEICVFIVSKHFSSVAKSLTITATMDAYATTMKYNCLKRMKNHMLKIFSRKFYVPERALFLLIWEKVLRDKKLPAKCPETHLKR